MTIPSSNSHPDTQADGRDGRVVGENGDSLMESFGKAIVAPLEGADEGVHDGSGAPPPDTPHTSPKSGTDVPTPR